MIHITSCYMFTIHLSIYNNSDDINNDVTLYSSSYPNRKI